MGSVRVNDSMNFRLCGPGKLYFGGILNAFDLPGKFRNLYFKKLFIKGFLAARCSHQTTGALPLPFPKCPSIGQNYFGMIISGIFFSYYKPLKATKNYYKLV
jgi:hypothetical protein